VLRWLRSTLRGEQSIAGLEARRRAGVIAYALIDEADDLESTDRGAQLFKVCAWNAFALQTIADTLIECDARDDPSTAGYVPRSTLRYAIACVEPVPAWVRRARIVQGDPHARLGVELPAHLPPWRRDEPTTHGELHGLRTAYETLQARVESSVHELPAGEDARVRARASRMLGQMSSCLEYVDAIMHPDLGPVDRGEVRERLLEALGSAFELGQLAAFPALVDATWLEIETGWLVLDCAGNRVGLVQRIHGDRGSGEFAGIDVSAGIAGGVHIPAGVVATIDPGEITLRVQLEELGLP
jgi:hypothetical protein